MYEDVKITTENSSGYYVESEISVQRMTSDKRYKHNKLKEILAVVSALLNTFDGTFVIMVNDSFDKDNDLIYGKCVKMMEQKVMDLIGWTTMNTNVNFDIQSSEKIVILIKKATVFISTSYNLFLQSQTQIMCIPCTESIEKVKEVILNKEPSEVNVVHGSHHKEFIAERSCGLVESKGVQFKNLKALATKHVTLGDRLAGESNKLPCYVSAFANQNGGHLYCGITDRGVVVGENILAESYIKEITRKVSKSILKMIWCDGQPQKGQHWDIFFEPVYNGNLNIIPLVYVIVIYVASYPHGVFTEAPESYIIVENQLKMLEFTEWKIKSSFCSADDRALLATESIPPNVQRCEWSSKEAEKTCTIISGYLQTFINNGKWNEFRRHLKLFEAVHESSGFKIDVQLVLLSKKVVVSYRKSQWRSANNELDEFKKLSKKSKNSSIFDVVALYLEAVMERSQNQLDNSNVKLSEALQIIETIPPGLMTAAVYSFGGILSDIAAGNECRIKENSSSVEKNKTRVLCTKALEHLQYVNDYPEMTIDLEEKTRITLTMNSLGCSLAGDLFENDVDEQSIKTAHDNLEVIREKSYKEGYGLNRLRKIQFYLAFSILNYRRSQRFQDSDKQKNMLQTAFSGSKRAQELAKQCEFDELARYAATCAAVCTEGLLKMSFRKMSHDKKRLVELPENG